MGSGDGGLFLNSTVVDIDELLGRRELQLTASVIEDPEFETIRIVVVLPSERHRRRLLRDVEDRRRIGRRVADLTKAALIVDLDVARADASGQGAVHGVKLEADEGSSPNSPVQEPATGALSVCAVGIAAMAAADSRPEFTRANLYRLHTIDDVY